MRLARPIAITATMFTALLAPSTNVSHAASTLRIEQFAPLPCSVACPHWDAAMAAGYDVCADPFPQGSFDETVMRMTSQEGAVEIDAYSHIDYDTFLCTNTEPRVLMEPLAHVYTEDCGSHFGPRWPVGCSEHLRLGWRALQDANGGTGDEFIIVSYNWSDTAPLMVVVSGPAEIVDDRYEARAP